MKQITKQIAYWCQILLIPIYLLSYLMPRKRNIWVIGSTFGCRFADNPKYFYLYLNQYQSHNVRAIWISKSKDIIQSLKDYSMEGYYLYSIRGLWFCLRAKVYLYDNYTKDICFTLSGGAVKINMWHGIPLKKIQKDNLFDRIRNPRTQFEKWRWALRRLSDEKPTDYVLTTSDFLKPIFSSAFNTKNVIVCGYPRNDSLISPKDKNLLIQKEKTILELLHMKAGQGYNKKKIVLYMPTFRDSEIEFFNHMKIKLFDQFLIKNNLLFCIKLHPKSKFKENFDALESDNIYVIEAESDPYIYLKHTDALITDYSSIYFDYLLLNKPILFFCYDFDQYIQNSREMYFDYNEFTPGIKVQTMEELENALLDIDAFSENYDLKLKREKIRDIVFDNIHDKGSEILYEYIRNKILANPRE